VGAATLWVGNAVYQASRDFYDGPVDVPSVENVQVSPRHEACFGFQCLKYDGTQVNISFADGLQV